jgi:hypothetical protein
MMLAEFELIQMADRIKVFPLVVLGVVVVMGLVLYWVATRGGETKPAPEAAPTPVPRPPRVEAPPPTNDPGQKILDGADGAFQNKMYPTALMFYKDFELRYAGTDVYDRNIATVWERIHTSNASSPPAKQEAELPAYLAKRRKLADEWTRLKPLLASPPSEASRPELLKFLEALPPPDGRRRIIEAWRDSK